MYKNISFSIHYIFPSNTNIDIIEHVELVIIQLNSFAKLFFFKKGAFELCSVFTNIILSIKVVHTGFKGLSVARYDSMPLYLHVYVRLYYTVLQIYPCIFA